MENSYIVICHIQCHFWEHVFYSLHICNYPIVNSMIFLIFFNNISPQLCHQIPIVPTADYKFLSYDTDILLKHDAWSVSEAAILLLGHTYC